MREIQAESTNIEYKKELNKDNKKWLKTIVAFSNTAGGEFIIGVEDKTLEIVGIQESRSMLEEKIHNCIFDSVIPRPNIELVFQTQEDKNIAIIQVAKGAETPYRLKNNGSEEVYIRFGSTDRKASQSEIRELQNTALNTSYSSQEFMNEQMKVVKISKKNIEIFLNDLNEIAEKEQIKLEKIDEKKLIEWKVILKKFQGLVATNGYMLMTNNVFHHARIRIGTFGKTVVQNKGEKEIVGTILEQYFETMDFLLEKLYLEEEIKTIRKPKYKIPEVTLREILANAIIHRNYDEPDTIKIRVFDNRIEIESPGGLYAGLQKEDMFDVISRVRNLNIAEVFKYLKIVEQWGSGILRANEALMEQGLAPLDIQIKPNALQVTMFYEEQEFMHKIDTKQIQIPEDILEQMEIFRRNDLEQKAGLTEDQARRLLEKWQKEQIIIKVGAGPSTAYKVIKR